LQTEKTVLHYLLYPESKRGRQKLKMDSCLLTQYESPSAAAIRQKKSRPNEREDHRMEKPPEVGTLCRVEITKNSSERARGAESPVCTGLCS
jgi:hypothetical protein